MPGHGLPGELLGQLAESLEETGRALKDLTSKTAGVHVQTSSLQTGLDSAHARLKKVEDSINGNGSAGLKTELGLVKKDIENIANDLRVLTEWRNSLTENKIKVLEVAQAESKKSHADGRIKGRNSLLTLLAIVIALGSMLSNCGPQWIKAWGSEKGSQNAGP